MIVTGTKRAFAKMLEERSVYKKLDVSRTTISHWRNALAGKDDTRMPTLNKMEEMLLRSGAKVVKEKKWRLKD